MKRNVTLRSGLVKNVVDNLAKPFYIFKMVSFLFGKLSRKEKLMFFILLSTLIVLFVFEGLKIYYAKTIVVPASGGEYVEMINGEVKYLSPVLVKTDAEKAISQAIYSSLVKVDQNGQLQPDLAERWEVSSDGLTYTFYLRQNVLFHNGQTFDSGDVVSTIEAIQNEVNKSPLRETWLDVIVDAPDVLTISFTLPKQYGPFIYNCVLEIMDSSDTVSSLSNNYNGTGPYKYVKAVPEQENNYLEVWLEKNVNYYSSAPMISQLRFIVTKDDFENIKKKYNLEMSGFAGVDYNADKFTNYSFTTGRRLVEFLNIRREPLNNSDLRKNIVKGETVENKIKLRIVSLDAEPQKTKASAIADRLQAQNITVENSVLSVKDYMEAISTHNYDILIYGYNWSYDNDPYMFWHSSQIEKNNFSGYSSKEDDIFLEDTRMILDRDQRIARYDQFIQKMTDNALVVYFDIEKYSFVLSNDVKNTDIQKSYGRPEDRLNGITSWYTKEKRVRK